MLDTNLLPVSERKIVRLEETRRIVRFLAALAAAVMGLGSILLLPSYLPQFLERQEFRRNLALEEGAAKKGAVRDQIMEAQAVHSASIFVKTRAASAKASAILGEFLENPGSGIIISSLSVKKGGSLSVTGLAMTRRDLLDFEKRLRDGGKFQEISSPLSNIIRETNINFAIQGKLKPPYGL